ncbi:hypothetical protein A0H81_11015 [Grifola frondosa]|uniref:Phosphatidylglycerol/phosphatidylinositol transfer protein n=1 Tax=Grifola frondosa TaxID=5627 RepID=A0A1C7LV94_GRIFR|nr:hypothetical protein A0H81_11015 [Grifola frondosa]
MKSLFVLACLAASALAQGCAIGAPAEFSTVTPGSNITVEVDRPDTLTGSQEIAIVIGLATCVGRVDNECATFNVSEVLGQILYSGPYDPQFHFDEPSKPPYQNFTVQVPTSLPNGQASLSVSHFSLIGAGPFPFLEVLNTTLIVES